MVVTVGKERVVTVPICHINVMNTPLQCAVIKQLEKIDECMNKNKPNVCSRIPKIPPNTALTAQNGILASFEVLSGTRQ